MSVPGEGVEPSRAEAHGFLRPARLPIPPSRPGRSRVAARSTRVGLIALLALAVTTCTQDVPPSSDAGVTTIAFLFGGSADDAELVTAPALAGLELAARQAGEARVEIEPVNLGLERSEVMASLRALGEDRGVVAAVVAPWTAPPEGAIELLADHGVPVVTLSWAWGPPREAAGDGLWLSLATGRAHEAVILLTEGADATPDGGTLCVAGDDQATSRELLATVEDLGRAAGTPEVVAAGIVSASDPAVNADAVAARIEDTRCPVLLWVGGATVVTSVLDEISDPPPVVATSRVKSDDGLDVAASGVEVRVVCACADVSLSTDTDRQRFVHDLQAESGSSPGPFAVEAYDVGRLLSEFSGTAGSEDPRASLRTALDGLAEFRGLDGLYRFEPDGSSAPESFEVGAWRAAGSRWLPVGRPGSPSG